MDRFFTALMLTVGLIAFRVPPNTFAGEQKMVWAYELMALPSQSEDQALQKTAEKYGIDLLTTLRNLPQDDLKAWARIFAVSLAFSRYDRAAQVYGYYIHAAWLYNVGSCGVDKYAKLLNAQPVRSGKGSEISYT